VVRVRLISDFQAGGFERSAVKNRYGRLGHEIAWFVYLEYFLIYLGLLAPVRLHYHLQNIRRFSVSKDLACQGGEHLPFAGLTAQRVPSVLGEVFLVDPDSSEGVGVCHRGLSSADSVPPHRRFAPLKRMRV
jgi:hypothetical protein